MTAYTLFSNTGGGALATDTASYTMGVQFSVNQSSMTLTAMHFYSASGAGSLPGTIALYMVTGDSLVHSETASWSGAAGSGWVKALFSSPPSLTSGTNYVGVVYNSGGSNWYSSTAHYWDTGSGASGITNGPLSAPNNGSAAHGQDSFDTSGVLTFPSGSFNATNYWVDPEVNNSSTSHTATASLTVTPVLARTDNASHPRTGTVTVSPSFRASKNAGKKTGLTIHPSFSASFTNAFVRHASLTVTPRLIAIGPSSASGLLMTGFGVI
jgi:hypothetical protein